jgi:hypothetical protein
MKYIVYEYNKLISVYDSIELALSSSTSTQRIDTQEDEIVISIQKDWRDAELKKTDYISTIPDYSNRSDYLDYRQALRDWPSTDNFPLIRPTL